MRYSGRPESGQRVSVRSEDAPQAVQSPTSEVQSQPLGTLPESSVEFDAGGGHAHTGTDSHTVDHTNLANVTANQHHAQAHALDGADHTLAGSAAGRILVATSATAFAVEAPGTRVIQAGTLAGIPAASSVPAGTLYLATDDDGGTLYRSDGTNWTQTAPGLMPLGSFYRANISTLGTTNSLLPNAWGGGLVGLNTMPTAGGVYWLSLCLSGDVGGVGADLIIELGDQSGATGDTLTLAGSADTGQLSAYGAVAHAFAAGDRLGLYARRVGTPSAVDMIATIWGRLS